MHIWAYPVYCFAAYRSVLSGVAKSTGGVVPSTSAVEAIWQHIARLGYTDEDGLVSHQCSIMSYLRGRFVKTVVHAGGRASSKE